MSSREQRPDVLIVGDAGSVARALVEPLSQLGLTSKQLADPTDVDVIDELQGGVGAVAVVTRDDARCVSRCWRPTSVPTYRCSPPCLIRRSPSSFASRCPASSSSPRPRSSRRCWRTPVWPAPDDAAIEVRAPDHVLVVGLGQIGLRLALRLRELRVKVLVVERDGSVAGVRLAHEAGLPVVIASGADAFTLRRLGIRRARAIAAVTSDDLVNVAIGLAARATAPDVAVVLRLGDGEVAAESESLLHLGQIFDAHRIAAEALAESLRSHV